MQKLLSHWLPLAVGFICLLLPAGATWAQTPAWQWADSPGMGYSKGTAADAAGNVYVTGRFSGSATFGATTLTSADTSDVFVAKLTSSGAYEWAVRAGGNAADSGLELAVDSSGNVYVAGYYNSLIATFGPTTLTQTAGSSVFVAKLNAAGVWQWAVDGRGSGYNADFAMALDTLGNLYLTGSYSGTATFGPTTLTSNGGADVYAAKLTPAGVWQWAASAGGPADDAGSGLALDGSGNVHLTGAFAGTATFGGTQVSSAGQKDVFVGSLNPAGQWRGVIRGGGSGIDQSTDLAVDGSGNVFITGTFRSVAASFGSTNLTNSPNPELGDLFVARLSAGGAWQWAVSAGCAGAEKSHGLAVSRSGNAYVTGSFDSPTTSFGSTTLPGSNDVYVAQVSAAGAWQWAKKAGGPGLDIGQELAVDGGGNVVMAGEFLGATMACGATTLTNGSGAYAFFISRLAAPMAVPDEEAVPRLTLFPNPAHQATRLTGAPSGLATLFDAWGRPVRTAFRERSEPETTLDLRGLPAGLYLLRCGPQTRRLVIE